MAESRAASAESADSGAALRFFAPVFTIDLSIVADALDVDEVTSLSRDGALFPTFDAVNVEQEYRRYYYARQRLLVVSGCLFQCLLALSHLISNDMSGGAAVFAGAQTALTMMIAVIVFFVALRDGNGNSARLYSQATQFSHLCCCTSFLLTTSNALVSGLRGADCPVRAQSERVCVRGHEFAEAAQLLLNVMTTATPLQSLAINAWTIVAFAAARVLSSDFPAIYVGLRLIVSIGIATMLTASVVWRDSVLREYFAALVRMAFTDMATQDTCDLAVEIIDRSLPVVMAKRIASGGARAEAFATKHGFVCVTAAVGKVVANDDMVKRMTELHNVFALFDAAVMVFGVDRGPPFGDEFIVMSDVLNGSDACASRVLRFALWQLELSSALLPLHSSVSVGDMTVGAAQVATGVRLLLAGEAVTAARLNLKQAGPGVLIVEEAALRMAHIATSADLLGEHAGAYNLRWTTSEQEFKSPQQSRLSDPCQPVAVFEPVNRTSPQSSSSAAEFLVPRDTPASLELDTPAVLHRFANPPAATAKSSGGASIRYMPSVVPLGGIARPSTNDTIADVDVNVCRGVLTDPKLESEFTAYSCDATRTSWDYVALCTGVIAIVVFMAASLDRVLTDTDGEGFGAFSTLDVVGLCALAACFTTCFVATCILRSPCGSSLMRRRTELLRDDATLCDVLPIGPSVATGILLLLLYGGMACFRDSFVTNDPFFVSVVPMVVVGTAHGRPLSFAGCSVLLFTITGVPLTAIELIHGLEPRPWAVVACVFMCIATAYEHSILMRANYAALVVSKRHRDVAAMGQHTLILMAETLVPAHALASCADYIRRSSFLTTESKLRHGGEQAAEALLEMMGRPHVRRVPALRTFENIAVCIIRVTSFSVDLLRSPLAGKSMLRDETGRAAVAHDFVWALDLHALIRDHPCFANSKIDVTETCGDDVVMAGPFLEDTDDTVTDRAAACFACLLDMLSSRCHKATFTAAITVDDVVGAVLGHGSLRYSLFGPAMDELRKIMDTAMAQAFSAERPTNAAFASRAFVDAANLGSDELLCVNCERPRTKRVTADDQRTWTALDTKEPFTVVELPLFTPGTTGGDQTPLARTLSISRRFHSFQTHQEPAAAVPAAGAGMSPSQALAALDIPMVDEL